MAKPIGIILCGVDGKMSQTIAQLCKKNNDFQVVGTTSRRSKSESLDAAIKKSAKFNGPRVVIDFTHADTAVSHAETAKDAKLPILIGSTSLSDKQKHKLTKIAKSISMVVAPNTSLGANFLAAICQVAGKVLPDADVEILDIHHRTKKDSPSGTAFLLGEAVAKGRKQDFAKRVQLNRHSASPRQAGEIGIVGLRGGEEKGQHTVYFLLDNERLEFTHRAADRQIFAQGALLAARFLTTQKPGLYNMFHVLGLTPLLNTL